MGLFHRLKASEVHAAAARIRPYVRRTPLVRSDELSRLVGAEVFLKLENRQVTGSFKLRGALNALSALDAGQRAAGVVASSAGNHGLGVAYAAQKLGIAARIFVPASAPEVKKRGIRELGAELDDTQPDYDAAMDAAKAFGQAHGRPYINPCLGDPLLHGQGTVALEIAEDIPALRALVVNVGGGGLLGGCATVLRAERPAVRIHGAQSEKTAAMSRSLAARRVVPIPVEPTLADGLAGQIDEDALDLGVHGLDQIVTVSEADIGRAIAWLARTHEEKVEGAGACGVAAVLSGKLRPDGPCAIVVSGGNIDEGRWRSLLTSGPEME